MPYVRRRDRIIRGAEDEQITFIASEAKQLLEICRAKKCIDSDPREKSCVLGATEREKSKRAATFLLVSAMIIASIS